MRTSWAACSPRARQRWYTLKPVTDNVEPWAERFFDWCDRVDESMCRYAEAYLHGEAAPETFYDADDPLIELARSSRDPATSTLLEVETALTSVDEQSTYAQVIAEGLEGVRAVDAFVESEVDTDEFKARLS